MIPVFSVKEQRHGIVTRTRFSPALGDHRAMCIESNGAMTIIDLMAVKYTSVTTYEHVHNTVTGFCNHLLDFNFTSDGCMIFIGDSFGSVTIDSLGNIGSHISKKRGGLLSIDNAHEGGVFTVLPSPNYEFLLYTGGGDGTIRVWDTRFMVPDNPLLEYRHRLEFSETDEGKGLPTDKPLHEIWAHRNAVSSLCFPDKELLVSSGVDENLRIWDTGENSAIATIRSHGTSLGIWDIAINRSIGRVAVVGQSLDVWAFYIKDFICNREPGIHKMVKFDFDDREPTDTDIFSRWRRICTYGKSVIVPTLNNQQGAKAIILDMASGSEIYRLTTPVLDRIHTVDAHPRLSSGILLTGGTKYNRTICTIWMDEQGVCPISV
ncbi:hypothetical protein BgAZ_303110 [Babesia gibsoni]|uniref:Uncharacterized protein n=1 Tax=Babesia gibsoni TaxID=33632 RepID=A0AAD8LNQ2_BABGI|nr:hypothetical protein BgAZ_303110 [Babesia gibsoni]